MIKDFFVIAMNSLAKRRLRTFLTMVGVFIGITAVVALISLGQGLQVSIEEEFNKLGVDKVFIQPAGSTFGAAQGAVILDEEDLQAVERTQGVDMAGGYAMQNGRIEFKDEQAFVLIMGITTEDEALWQDFFGPNLAEGRFIGKGDTSKAYVGHNFRTDELFDREARLFDKLTINGEDFDIVGFQESLGNNADDSAVYLSAEAYERVFNKSVESQFGAIVAKTIAGEEPTKVRDRIEKNLRDERDLDAGEEDFEIQTTEEFLDSFNSILLIVNVVIIGIAAISLIVGGIGIMNTMYTAVLEQTKEIGIMKAIGARNSDVLLIFLFESGLLGVVGGIVGVTLGLLLAKAVEIGGGIAWGTDFLRAWWSWYLIAGSIAFGFIAGAGSGLAPAYQASKQQPVDALRYE